ncbi:alpha/beta hydrolase [Nocardia sp. CDC153]|uniref:alpha/beta fold hydrolase n=1 Tax=Nocardia sp. CDC153 TaxID=3112167 RepID=UPI002DBB2ED1|nr:alpha/beta hydrolase [Nocardia sp. CDC153]MEC3957182.1 alpha/beta hydrolase [Nocardia sp. CDC153]
MTVRELPHLADVEHRFIDVGGLRTHVALAGGGEPLVLLHGWPQHWWQWRHMIGPLAQHFRVICPDLRGLGWTDAPPNGYRPAVMADDIAGLLDELGVDRFRAIGHDWGGLVGYLLALRFPERMRHYIAINTASPFLRPTPRVLADGVRLWHIAANAAPLVGPLLAAHTIPDWALRHWTYRSATMTSEDRAIFLTQFEEPARVAATVSYYRNLITHEIPLLLSGQYRWSRLRVPTLILAGNRDPLLPVTATREFGSLATDIRVEVFDEVGHFPATEQPERVVERAMEFFGYQKSLSNPSKPPKSP